MLPLVKIKLLCAEIRPRPHTREEGADGGKEHRAAFYHRDAEEKRMGTIKRPVKDLSNFCSLWSGALLSGKQRAVEGHNQFFPRASSVFPLLLLTLFHPHFLQEKHCSHPPRLNLLHFSFLPKPGHFWGPGCSLGGILGSRTQAGHWQNREKPLTASCSFLLSQVTHPSSSSYLTWHSVTPKGSQTPPAPISCQSLCTSPELPALQPCKDCINI